DIALRDLPVASGVRTHTVVAGTNDDVYVDSGGAGKPRQAPYGRAAVDEFAPAGAVAGPKHELRYLQFTCQPHDRGHWVVGVDPRPPGAQLLCQAAQWAQGLMIGGAQRVCRGHVDDVELGPDPSGDPRGTPHHGVGAWRRLHTDEHAFGWLPGQIR